MTNTEIANASKIMLGSTEAIKMYIGSTLIWQLRQHSVRFLDILYSDSNGNLSYTSEVLSVSEGKTPIALCIAGEDFFGSNEKPRWMSLKYMNYTTPETGSLTSQGICWGNYSVDISDIANIKYTYNGGGTWGYLTSEWITGTQNKIPTLFNQDDEWNISTLGTVNLYAVTDIDGKNKTLTLIATATTQSTWRTDSSITNNGNNNYAPAACCCQRYHTLGTYAGNWYLGAGGEMSIIVVRRNEINSKLLAISNIYPNNCISSLANGEHWTSTEDSDINAYNINTNDGGIGGNNKSASKYVIALLLYKSEPLSAGYTQLEYISSSSGGNQYIDLGIKLYETLNTNYDIAMKFNIASGNANLAAIFACQDSDNDPWPGTFVRVNSSSGKVIGRYIGGTAKDNTLGNLGADIELQVQTPPNKNVINLNNNNSTHQYGTSLFCAFVGGTNTPARYCNAKLYYFKLFVGGTLVRDLIPCKNSNNVVGMYDVVNNVFYTSPNGNAFVAGPAV